MAVRLDGGGGADLEGWVGVPGRIRQKYLIITKTTAAIACHLFCGEYVSTCFPCINRLEFHQRGPGMSGGTRRLALAGRGARQQPGFRFAFAPTVFRLPGVRRLRSGHEPF